MSKTPIHIKAPRGDKMLCGQSATMRVRRLAPQTGTYEVWRQHGTEHEATCKVCLSTKRAREVRGGWPAMRDYSPNIDILGAPNYRTRRLRIITEPMEPNAVRVLLDLLLENGWVEAAEERQLTL